MEMGKDIWDVKTDLGSWVKGLLCSLSQGMASSDSYWVKINQELRQEITSRTTYAFPEYGPVWKGETNFIAEWSSARSDRLWINLSWYLDLPHKLSSQTVSGKQLFGVTTSSFLKETPLILWKSLLSRIVTNLTKVYYYYVVVMALGT